MHKLSNSPMNTEEWLITVRWLEHDSKWMSAGLANHSMQLTTLGTITSVFSLLLCPQSKGAVIESSEEKLLHEMCCVHQELISTHLKTSREVPYIRIECEMCSDLLLTSNTVKFCGDLWFHCWCGCNHEKTPVSHEEVLIITWLDEYYQSRCKIKTLWARHPNVPALQNKSK